MGTDADGPDDDQMRINDAVWAGHRFFDDYTRHDLRPPEAVILLRHRAELGGRILELGSGGGRVTRYLVELSDHVLGLDLSAAMVEYCRRKYPQASFEEGDMRDISGLGAEAFDVIVAAANVLDVLGDVARNRSLAGFHAALRPGGLLVFSSHNRAFGPKVHGPLRIQPHQVPRLARRPSRLPRGVLNRRRLARYQREEPGYAILNDEAMDFALLHYYIGRDAQERQLADQGFELVECLDTAADGVPAGEEAAASSELHYVARRAA